MNSIAVENLTSQIALVTLNRPDAYNALNLELIQELTECFRAMNRNREVRVVILSGAGKAFCAGADLKSFAQPGDIEGTEGMSAIGFTYKFQELLTELMLAIRECDKPVISAVNGVAVGGGLAITLASDLRVASAKARFGSVFIKTGLSSCDVGTSYLLPRIVGPHRAAELMMTGRIIDAEQALRYDLVLDVVEPGELINHAQNLAEQICANSEYGVWMTKKGLWANLDAPSLRHAMELENRTQVLGTQTGCMEESMTAFVEGREPQWKPL